MTEGISKERLIAIKQSLPYGQARLNLERLITTECKELDPWLPIESAPKDGEEIQLCSIFDQAVCYWRDDGVMTGWTWGLENKFLNPIGWKKLSELPRSHKLLPEDPK